MLYVHICVIVALRSVLQCCICDNLMSGPSDTSTMERVRNISNRKVETHNCNLSSRQGISYSLKIVKHVGFDFILL